MIRFKLDPLTRKACAMDEKETESVNQPKTVFEAISSSLARNLPRHLAVDVCENLSTVYGCAVAHALRDFELVSGKGDFGEEDRTASLIGHLGSHLGWYLALADLSGLNNEQPSVSWSYQSKKAEAEKGGDFGLALRLADDKYNIALFQAKNTDLDNHPANLWRPPYGYTPVSRKKVSSEKAMEAYLACKPVDEELIKAMNGERLNVQSGAGQHQFVKLALLADKTKEIAPGCNWIHYVLWPTNHSNKPIVFDLPRLQAIFKQSGKTKIAGAMQTSSMNVDNPEFRNADTFAALLMRGAKSGAAGWLTVNRKKARNLIGDLTELCNRWMIVEDQKSGGALANSLKNDSTSVFQHQPPLDGISPLVVYTPPTTPPKSTKKSHGI